MVVSFFCITAEPTPHEVISPCSPSPCGSNAICREQNGAGSCTCLPEYIGNPYEGCRPECTLNTDCAPNKACIRSKCQDPCPGTCGPNADCQVVNHIPMCTCRVGYTGDPFRHCNIAPTIPPRNIYCIALFSIFVSRQYSQSFALISFLWSFKYHFELFKNLKLWYIIKQNFFYYFSLWMVYPLISFYLKLIPPHFKVSVLENFDVHW